VNNKRGVAIVILIGVLAILIVIGLSFALNMRLDLKTSQTYRDGVKARYLAEAGLEAAKSAINYDKYGSDGVADYNDGVGDESYDHLEDNHLTVFNGEEEEDQEVDNDGDGITDSAWFEINDSTGRVVGRYAVLVNDEASKMNLNYTGNLSIGGTTHGIASGASTFEMDLERFLAKSGISSYASVARDMINYRFGLDRRPGLSGFDDDGDSAYLDYDGIDNDADGVVDNPTTEGIDEPDEFQTEYSQGDDKPFRTVREIISAGVSEDIYNQIKHKITVDSFDHNITATGAPRLDINQINDPEVLRNLLSSKGINFAEQRACNLLDYCDYNSAATIMSYEGKTYYGVEAVQITEVLAKTSGTFEAEGADTSGVDTWKFENGFYSIEVTYADDTWVFGGFGANMAYWITIYSNVANSDGYEVNGEKFSSFDNQGQYELPDPVFSDAAGNITLTLRDDGDIGTSRFDKIKVETAGFIELENLSERSINLDGWDILNNYSTGGAQILPDYELGPRQSVALVAELDKFQQSFGTEIAVLEIPTMRFDPDGEEVFLRDADNNIVSYVQFYGAGSGVGISREKDNPTMDIWWYDASQPSPAAQNPSHTQAGEPYPYVKNGPLVSIGEIGEVSDGHGSISLYLPAKQWGNMEIDIIERTADLLTTESLRLEAESAPEVFAPGWSLIIRNAPNTDWYKSAEGDEYEANWVFDSSNDISNGTYNLYIYGAVGYPLAISTNAGETYSPHLDPDEDGVIDFGQVIITDKKLELAIKNQSGKEGYFDYAMLSPRGRIPGRININTASEEVLWSLPGMDQNRIDYITTARAFTDLGDVLGLFIAQGLGVVDFAKIANLITVRSDVYEIISLGQAFDENGNVSAERKIRVIFER